MRFFYFYLFLLINLYSTDINKHEEEVFMNFILESFKNTQDQKIIEELLESNNAFFLIVYKLTKHVKYVEENSDLSIVIVGFIDDSKLIINNTSLVYIHSNISYDVPLTEQRVNFLLEIIYLTTKNNEQKVLLEFMKDPLINIINNQKKFENAPIKYEPKIYSSKKKPSIQKNKTNSSPKKKTSVKSKPPQKKSIKNNPIKKH
ncbi:hypothetical protein AB836_01560 [Rickettsiales bacterium (ex Bugula neritina AB1)]|nr:hypothetical protein AB836_01560 [Rickettsiales bacterium (ex Bugula neritina AB1)]